MTDTNHIGDVVIVGGGMAGCTVAWELTRGDWRSRHRSVTMLERSPVLGGKGSSVRGHDGRILEHGLHVWLGYYDNAFRLMQECYDELDRPTTDPDCPIQTWRDAFTPAPDIGVFDRRPGGSDVWLATFPTNELVPGTATDLGLVDLLERGLDLARTALRSGLAPERTGVLVDLVATMLRGIAADGLLAGDGGFDRVDHEDFRDWLRRHRARESTLASGVVRGMYDLVFAYRRGQRSEPGFSAGLGVFLAVRMFLDYKGSMFWKMTAGMGDVVFAPLQQVLVDRGVEIVHEAEVEALEIVGGTVERLHVRSPSGERRSGPLRRIGGLPVFTAPGEDSAEPSESTTEVWRRGERFETVVLAASVASLESMVGPLADAPRWRAMLDAIETVATWSVPLWLRPTEAELGAAGDGSTLSALEAPLDTVASMSHLLAFEEWDDDAPQSLTYLCSSTSDAGTGDDSDAEQAAERFLADHGAALSTVDPITTLGHPSVRSSYCVRHDRGSDRYVQSLPGTGKHRLRVDESGVENLVLAGDWTDSGLNAGCIEAAVISGLEAAAVIEGRPLTDRVLGPLTWDFR